MPGIIEAVISAWRKFPKPRRDEHEVPITRRFRLMLIQERNLRQLPVRIDRESVEDDLETGGELGRIDLRFLFEILEHVYFALECKRLNVVRDGKRASLAGKYVSEGMMRFVEGKYGRRSKQGGMLGYVMAGDRAFAIAAVDDRVRSEHVALRQVGGKGLERSSLFPSNEGLKGTRHRLGKRCLVLHHLFLLV